MSTAETCAECGFDSQHWRVYDAGTLFGALGYWWRLATTGLATDALNHRPAVGTWSALEYGLHVSLATAVIRHGVELVLAHDGCELPEPPEPTDASDDDWTELDPVEVGAALAREGRQMETLARRGSAQWSNSGRLPDGSVIEAQATLIHAAHDASHHFMDVGLGLAAIGSGTRSAVGTVAQINASNGGVPKHPIREGVVGWTGLEGDRQADRKHHGRPFQALCLWSAEVEEELAAAGHPIGAGSAGENLTLAGIDWASLRPGARLEVGTAHVELSYPAVPCKKQTRWFADGDFSRISYEQNPQWARWYAWVRRPGLVRPGDDAVVQPRQVVRG
jgi:MOSC domain-containing protein YiiM